MNANSYTNQKRRGLKRKLEVINSLGGCCSRCGYKRNIAALEFHHLDPNEKEFQIDLRHFSNSSLEKLKQELDKCILLCANCHREEHNPHLSENNYTSLLQVNKKSFTNPGGRVCPVCNNRFKIITGKIYCSTICRDNVKNYPTLNQINSKYLELKSWEKVAQFYNITRRITQNIRKQSNASLAQLVEQWSPKPEV